MSMPDLPPGGVLALDLSRTTGWAYGHAGNRVPAFGVWHLPNGGLEGARYAAFENVLADAMDRLAPSCLVLEAPLPLMAQTHAKTAQQQYTLRGFACAEAWRGSAALHEVDAFTVRAEVLGKGRFAKDQVKREVVRYCRGRGLKVPDHNAGDAVLVWIWFTDRARGRPVVAGPLFQARETIQ